MYCSILLLKNNSSPKIDMLLLFILFLLILFLTHHFVNVGSGDVFQSTSLFWSFMDREKTTQSTDAVPAEFNVKKQTTDEKPQDFIMLM